MLNYLKKNLNIIFLIILLTIPFKINASTYDIFGLEFKINNTDFNIFRKGNMNNREQLDTDFVNFIDNIFNDGGFLYATTDNSSKEIFVYAYEYNDVNLNMQSEENIKNFENMILYQNNAKKHDIYEFNNYKYIFFQYNNKNIYIIDYYTIMNGYIFLIRFQQNSNFTNQEKQNIKSLIDNIIINNYQKTYNFFDLTLNYNESGWFYFTRDNLKNNPSLNKLGISYEYVNNFFNNNKDCYMNAVKINNNLKEEFFIIAKESKDYKNLNEESNINLNKYMEDIAQLTNSKNIYPYEFKNNKYIFAEYYDSKLHYNIIDYYTIFNKKAYIIKFQQEKTFNTEQKETIKKIINSIEFKNNRKYVIVNNNYLLYFFIILILLLFGVLIKKRKH